MKRFAGPGQSMLLKACEVGGGDSWLNDQSSVLLHEFSYYCNLIFCEMVLDIVIKFLRQNRGYFKIKHPNYEVPKDY